jgi:hypothetical protein
MAEASFEFALERLFADAPAMPDADLFALQVTERLNRGWGARRLLISIMGVAGGLIGAYQVFGLEALPHLESYGDRVTSALNAGLAQVVPTYLAPGGVEVSSQTLWMAAVLALIAAGLGLARFIREV